MFFESFNLQQSFAHNPPSIDCEGCKCGAEIGFGFNTFHRFDLKKNKNNIRGG